MKKIIYLLIIFLISVHCVTARTHTAPPTGLEDFLIENYDLLPFKDQRGYQDWAIYVNDYLTPTHKWEEDFSNTDGNRSAKCLSYGASTVNDWFKLMIGAPFDSYQNKFYEGDEL